MYTFITSNSVQMYLRKQNPSRLTRRMLLNPVDQLQPTSSEYANYYAAH